MEPDLLQEYVHEDIHQRHEYRLTLRRVRLILCIMRRNGCQSHSDSLRTIDIFQGGDNGIYRLIFNGI